MSKQGLESDGTEELWMTEFVCIAKRHEHGQQFQADDSWPMCPRRRWPVAAMRRSITNTIRVCFSTEERQPRFKCFMQYSHVLLVNRKNDKVCDGVFFKP